MNGVNFESNVGSGKTYWYIYQGSLRRKIKDHSEALDGNGNLLPTFEKRTNKENVEIIEQVVKGGIEGFLKELNITNSPNFGYQLEVVLENDGEKHQIGIPMFSTTGSMQSFAGSFADQSHRMDFTEPMKLTPYYRRKYGQGKEDTGIDIVQDGENIKFEPKGFFDHLKANKPMAVEGVNEITGKKEWDWKAPTKWQYEQLLTAQKALVEALSQTPQPVVAPTPQPAPTPAPQPSAPEATPATADVTDDLPF